MGSRGIPDSRQIEIQMAVITLRKKYYEESERYQMRVFDASDAKQVELLPDSNTVIVILEGISMYLSNEQVNGLFRALQEKYSNIHILMDVYTKFGAKASKYKNPVNDVGVVTLWEIDNVQDVLVNTEIKFIKEHSFTPANLVDELKAFDRAFFNMMFTGSFYGKVYRLLELEK